MFYKIILMNRTLWIGDVKHVNTGCIHMFYIALCNVSSNVRLAVSFRDVI